MAYIVAEPCVKCKYTDCVAVCPVNCFYEGENSIVIHPEECIDCGACEPECPTTAIFEEDSLPEKWSVWVGINAVLSGAQPVGEVDSSSWPARLKKAADEGSLAVWPNISEAHDALPEADEMAQVEDKIEDLDPAGFRGG